MSEKQLPEILYVRRNEDDPESPFLMASEKKSEIAEQEETVIAGIYRLGDTVEIINETRLG